MCGIFGIYNFKKKFDQEDILQDMSEVLKHRGQDDYGVFSDEKIGIGHRRLSILDLSENGKQPLKVKNFLITYNGEIYNYVELRKELIKLGYQFKTETDTEVILNLYIHYGDKFLEKLRGMFSFAIYDIKTKSLFCARDRFGIKPFYYYKDYEKFIFASEIKAIFKDPKVQRSPNDKIIYDFLVFNRTDHHEETSFENIFNLRPGCSLEVSQSDFKITNWYKIKNLKTSLKNDETQIKNFKEILDYSVKIHLRSDVKIGTALSGGLDSSAITCIMNSLESHIKPETFSAIYDFKWDKNESKYAEIINRYTNANSNKVIPTGDELLNEIRKLIYHQEEPFGSSSIFASWKVMEKANKNQVKVLLNGQGADEILGYEYMAAFYFYELLSKFKLLKLLKEIIAFLWRQKYNRMFTTKVFIYMVSPRIIKDKIINSQNSILDKNFLKSIKTSNFQKEFFNVKTHKESVIKHLNLKLNHLLRTEDKNSMAFGVETRLPFLDHKLVENTLQLSTSLKIRNGINKYILRRAMIDRMPEEILNRYNKIGFETPQAIWFRERNFSKFLIETFNSPSFKSRKYFNHNKVLVYLDQHLNLKKDRSSEIWKALYLELWFKIFIDE